VNMQANQHRALSLVAALLAATLLAACGGSGAAGPASSFGSSVQSNVPFTPCSETDCFGIINGAAYEIVMPQRWNGTLLLYSHGYRSAQPVPPDFAPVSTAPEPAPGWSSGNRALGNALLEQGYALAGSAYASNGWAVADGVKANEELYEFFRANVGSPDLVIAWGDSLGGLITAELAQDHDWVSGALPMCGVLAGVNPNFDLGLDLALVIRELLDPELPVGDLVNYETLMTQFQDSAQRIVDAADAKRPEDNLRLLLAATLVGAPTQTQRQDGSTVRSVVEASAEGILAGLAFATVAQQELQTRLGGNPSTNLESTFRDRLSAEDRERLEAYASELGIPDGPQLLNRWLNLLETAPRTAADASARSLASDLGAPTGNLRQPTLVVHTKADPLVIVENLSWFAQRAVQEGAQDLLQTVVIEPPTRYPATPGAPYGAGHCTFTSAQRLAAVAAVDAWVRTGERPTADELRRDFGPGTVVEPSALPWPGQTQPD
jgi:hypothetical protein